MANDSNWTEVGDSYPSCQRIYVREGIVGPGGGISLVPPLILDDTRTVGTSTLGALAVQGVSNPLTGTTRITLKAKNAGSDSSVIRWLRSDDALRWSLGTDVNGNGNNNLWLFDNAQGIYGLYFPSGAAGDTTGSIRWGIGGRVAYDTTTNAMTRRVNNVVRETLDPSQWTLTSGGAVNVTAVTGMQLTSTLGMALQGGAGLILQSLDNGTLQAANAQAITAGTTLTATSGGAMTLQTTDGHASLLAGGAGNVIIVGPNLVTISTPADVAVNGNASVTITSGAGTIDINCAGACIIDSVTKTIISNDVAHPVGFYGAAGVAKQVGVPVTAAGIHAALVALGLIGP